MSEEKTIAEKLTLIANNTAAMYNSGFVAGRRAEYDAYWNTRQDYGNRTNYQYGFYHERVPEWFYPKYDICPVKAPYFMRDAFCMNANGSDNNKVVFDLVERLKECGIKMDFSQCGDVTYLFYQARVTRVPEIDLKSVSPNGGSGEPMFGGYIETVDKLIVYDGRSTANTFGYCTRLKNIVIEGVLSSTTNVSSATKLTLESAISFITHLKDYSGTESEGVNSIKFSDATWQLLDADKNSSPTGTTWREYITLLGWGT